MSEKNEVSFMNEAEELLEHSYNYSMGNENLEAFKNSVTNINKKINSLCDISCMERERIFFSQAKMLFDDIFLGKFENCKQQVIGAIHCIETYCTKIEVQSNGGIIRSSDPICLYKESNAPFFYLDNNALIKMTKNINR